MKFVTFGYEPLEARLGALVGERVVDLDIAYRDARGVGSPFFRDMLSLIRGGQDALDLAADTMERAPDDAYAALDEVRLRAPLPEPPQIRDFLAFEAHLRGSLERSLDLAAARAEDPVAARSALGRSGRFDVPEIWHGQPLYYKANRFAVSGPGDEVHWPEYSELIDYELELAAVIGRKVRDVPASRARQAIFGYMIFNDFSARDVQIEETAGMLGPAKAKDFDGANAFGPCLVTADEIPDPYALRMIARVNGETRCDTTSAAMRWSFEQMIEHVSREETLHPGEIFGSGAPGGGTGLELGRFLEPGDEVELEIERIGVLANRIAED
jgi:2-keto-4-pentenoate hydratase/2-oxohepta-3-ene-1,7-dioic acid hydratase in catechol pathway